MTIKSLALAAALAALAVPAAAQPASPATAAPMPRLTSRAGRAQQTRVPAPPNRASVGPRLSRQP